MANQRDDRFDERERLRYSPTRSQEWEERREFESRDQWDQSQRYGGERQRQEDLDWQRPRGEQHWVPRRQPEYSSGPRHFNQGAADNGEYRDRPYSNSSSYSGHGGYAGHLDPYREERDRGYGATSSGAEWGATGTSRHRVGSLTESAAASAQSVISNREEARDYRYGESHAGKGPKGYRPSDERIREEVCELLTRSHEVDATNIEVTVADGLVTLAGTVKDRRSKRVAEDVAQEAWGARDVSNQIRVHEFGQTEGRALSNEPTSRGNGSPGSVLGLSQK